MYWTLEALTAARTEMTQTIEGSLEDVKAQASLYGLEILSIEPNYAACVRAVFQKPRLSSAILAVFFKDFADMHRCGLSLHETMHTLEASSSHKMLKEALCKIDESLQEGSSLEEAFIQAKIFPRIVGISLSAAEKTGNILELLEVLAAYFKFKEENIQQITRALIYPAIVFSLLSALAVFIAVSLVPQLKMMLPSAIGHNLAARILIAYADCLTHQGVLAVLVLGLGVGGLIVLWGRYQHRLTHLVLRLPFVGRLIQSQELAYLFLNLYVYQKSGINIVESISRIHQARRAFITDKLLLVKERIFKGMSLAEAFQQDPFFPPFVYQSLGKAEITGYLPQSFERIYRYYDLKFKEAIRVLLALVEPVLMLMAAGFLLMIVCAFILPVYTHMNAIGSGTF